MRITSKGQVTIPKDMRDRFGLQPETEVEFVIEGNALRLVHATSFQRGSKLIQQMKGMATSNMSTDEIMTLTRG